MGAQPTDSASFASGSQSKPHKLPGEDVRVSELKSIDDLKPAPFNPREISPEAFTGLKHSVGAFGDISGLTYNSRSGHLVTGHQRLAALKSQYGENLKLDDHSVACPNGDRWPVRVVDWDDATEKAANIAANSPEIAGEFTPDLGPILEELKVELPELSANLRFDDLDVPEPLLNAEGLTDPDDVPEPPEKPVSERGDLWLMGDHRLLCGDCTVTQEVEKVMAGEKADCVFTSPPYAVGINYGIYQDTIENLRLLLPKLGAIWHTVVCDGGFAIVNFGDIVPGRDIAGEAEPCEYPMALEYWPVFRAVGWTLWSRRVAQKPIYATDSPWSAQSNRAASNWEHIWTWKRPGKPVVGHSPESASGLIGYAELGEGGGKKAHAAGMGVHWPRRCIAIHARERGIVHEPLCGSGTTIIAAEQLGRKCYAIEIEPRYVDVSVRRWQNFTGKKAKTESGKVMPDE